MDSAVTLFLFCHHTPYMYQFSGTFQNDGIYFVGVTWCGHCQRAKPLMEELSRELGTALPVYHVDGDKWQTHLKRHFGQNAPKSYPTIYYVSSNGSRVVVFNDERTLSKLRDFACDMSGSC